MDFVISTLNRGGAENKLVAVANGIDNTKYSVRVLVLKGGPLTAELTVPFHENIISNKYSITGFLSLISLLRKRRTQIVWVVGNGDAGFFGRIAAKLAFVRVVIQSLHATERFGGKPTIDPLNRILDLLGFLTTKYIAVAESQMEYLVNREGIEREKIEYIYNGVNTAIFQPGLPNKTLMAALKIPEDVDVVGIVARFKPEKRHLLFLDAAAEITKIKDSVHFLIVGDGPLEQSIKKKISSLGLEEQVHFAGGVNNVAQYYKLMTLSVLCSTTEAFPNVVIESMASGVPVVTTDVGSVSEAIFNKVTGMLVQKDDYIELANAINALLSDERLRKSITEEALQKVNRYFTLGIMIEKREKLFQDLFYQKYSSV